MVNGKKSEIVCILAALARCYKYYTSELILAFVPQVQKALVENTMVPCINAKPYQYTELLMTLPDLASHFFPRVSLSTCRAMLDALAITLYRPNS